MNDNDKVFRHDKTRDATQVRECNENNEWMLRKTNNEIKENDQKIKKSSREDERHDWRKCLNKNNDQIVDDRDFNFFSARNQRSFKAKVNQKNEINDMN